jgi:Protein of unknown function (DUF2817)
MTDFFASNYADARSTLLSVSTPKSSHLKTYRNEECETEGSGDLVTDSVRFGPDRADRFLVMISGTHGVEGYCGSACQTAAVKLGLFDDLPSDVGVLLIHALNPYGFAHDRRVNERNVDLNRNCVADFGSTELRELNPDYEVLSPVLNTKTWSMESPHVDFDKILQFIKEWGLERFQAAVSIGQYRHSSGLFYGGSEKSWSRLTLEEIISTEIPMASEVVVIDYHTGLGQSGIGELITMAANTSDEYRRALFLYGEHVKSTKSLKAEDKSVSADVNGSIDNLFANRGIATCVSLEFGTVDVLQVLEALRADNWFHHHGNGDAHMSTRIAADMRRAFYPDSEAWRQAVLHRSAEVVSRVLAGFQKTGAGGGVGAAAGVVEGMPGI